MNKLNTTLQSYIDQNILNIISQKTDIKTKTAEDIILQIGLKLITSAKRNLASNEDSTNLINIITNKKVNDQDIIKDFFTSIHESKEETINKLSQNSGINHTVISLLIPITIPLVIKLLKNNINLYSESLFSDENDIPFLITNFIQKNSSYSK